MGASAVAGEILALVEQKIAENRDKTELVAVLHEIEKKAKEIKDSADADWY